MRISTQQIFDSGLQNMQDVTKQLKNTQEQLSSGKRVNNPSDDPVAAARILQLNQNLAQSGQYQTSIKLATNQLSQEDATLSSVGDTLTSIRSLVVQAGNGSLNSSDLKDIAGQLSQNLNQLVGLANTKDSSGEYVFSGFQGTKQPFIQDATGNWVYQGDQGQRSLEIDTGVKVAVNDSGDSVFVNVPSANNTIVTQASSSNTAQPPATISAGKITDQATFDQFYPNNMVVQISTGSAGQLQYSVKDRASGRQLVAPTDFKSGGPITVEGAQFQITGQPAAGDSFFVQSSKTKSVFRSVQDLIDGLKNYNNTPAGQKAFNQLVSDTLTNLDNAQNNVLETRSDVGARLNTLDSTKTLHTNSDQQTQTVLSQLQDLDYAKAATQLSMQNFVLQAAQTSFAQVSRLSLFNKL